MKKIVLTGGSGFIGTNLIELLVNNNFKIINIDCNEPRNKNHLNLWVNENICNLLNLKVIFDEFLPDYVIHLASRTDLNGSSIKSYDENILGTRNMVELSYSTPSIKRIIFTSSMLVCRLGYIPKNDDDYNPSTFYGESKVISEKIIKNSKDLIKNWVIVRPTSIWGPWFDAPYLNFFEQVLKSRYMKFVPANSLKTFGYVGNTVDQLLNLLLIEDESIYGKVYYLGDSPPLNIDIWADKIASIGGIKPPRRVPFIAIYFLSIIGDILKKFNLNFPMTSFRLQNMTTNNVVDVSRIENIASEMKYSVDSGVSDTINWIKSR